MKCFLCDNESCRCESDIALPTKSTLSTSVTEFPDPNRKKCPVKSKASDSKKSSNMKISEMKISNESITPSCFESMRDDYDEIRYRHQGFKDPRSEKPYKSKPYIPFEDYTSKLQNQLKDCSMCSQVRLRPSLESNAPSRPNSGAQKNSEIAQTLPEPKRVEPMAPITVPIRLLFETASANPPTKSTEEVNRHPSDHQRFECLPIRNDCQPSHRREQEAYQLREPFPEMNQRISPMTRNRRNAHFENEAENEDFDFERSKRSPPSPQMVINTEPVIYTKKASHPKKLEKRSKSKVEPRAEKTPVKRRAAAAEPTKAKTFRNPFKKIQKETSPLQDSPKDPKPRSSKKSPAKAPPKARPKAPTPEALSDASPLSRSSNVLLDDPPNKSPSPSPGVSTKTLTPVASSNASTPRSSSKSSPKEHSSKSSLARTLSKSSSQRSSSSFSDTQQNHQQNLHKLKLGNGAESLGIFIVSQISGDQLSKLIDPSTEKAPAVESRRNPPKEKNLEKVKDLEESEKVAKSKPKKEVKEKLKKEPKETLERESKEKLKKESKESTKKESKEKIEKESKEEPKEEPTEKLKKESKETHKKDSKEKIRKDLKVEPKEESKEKLKKESKETSEKVSKEKLKSDLKEKSKEDPKDKSSIDSHDKTVAVLNDEPLKNSAEEKPTEDSKEKVAEKKLPEDSKTKSKSKPEQKPKEKPAVKPVEDKPESKPEEASKVKRKKDPDPENPKKTSKRENCKRSEDKMSQDVGSCCAKYILCLFNFIFFILGSLVLGLGLWLLIDKNSIVSLLKNVNSEHVERFTEPQLIDQSVYILIAIGGLMFFLGFLGYCGAIRESQCLLSLYGVFVIILLVLEIVVFSFALIYKDVAKDEAQNFLKSSIRDYKSSAKESDGSTLMWNTLMGRLECCGVNSYNDFDASTYWQQNKSSRVVPEACCKLSDKTLLKPIDNNCPYSPSDVNSNYMKGCYDSLINYLEFNKSLVLGVSGGLIFIQLFAAFLAFCLS